MKSCNKCSSLNLSVSHVPEGRLIKSSSLSKIENEFIRSSEYELFYKLTANKEHLHFSCRECGFDWRENTANAAQISN